MQNDVVAHTTGPRDHQWDVFDGFQIEWEEDPITEQFLLTPVPGIQPYFHDEPNIKYFNALRLMVAAFGAKDIREPGFNFPFFATISHEIGSMDTLSITYVYESLIERRHMFNTHYGFELTRAIRRGSSITAIMPYTALASMADELLLVEYELGEVDPELGDDKALNGPGKYFAHKMASKICNGVNKRLLKDVLSEARVVAAREEMLFVAKSVAKTMIEMDILNNFTNIKTCLSTEDINGERLVKTVAKAMVDADLLAVVPDLVKFLMQKITRTVHLRINEITDRINNFCKGVAEQFFERDDGKRLQSAIDDILVWDSNIGRNTFSNYLNITARLAKVSQDNNDKDEKLGANDADDKLDANDSNDSASTWAAGTTISGNNASKEDEGEWN
ncbi:hypothetical protein F4803DRAFT_571405 [Xylaria telfairii]|nr:hypothetical protein F4803DRAFT_571405 [Xylaria telfairii]